jgi:hypothetical protein
VDIPREDDNLLRMLTSEIISDICKETHKADIKRRAAAKGHKLNQQQLRIVYSYFQNAWLRLEHVQTKEEEFLNERR